MFKHWGEIYANLSTCCVFSSSSRLSPR